MRGVALDCCIIQRYHFKKSGDLVLFKDYCPECKSRPALFYDNKKLIGSRARDKFYELKNNKLIKKEKDYSIQSGSKTNLDWTFADYTDTREYIKNFNNTIVQSNKSPEVKVYKLDNVA